MLFIVLCILVAPISCRLKIYWEDTNNDDLVEQQNPGEDLEHYRMAVSLVNQELRFKCKVDKASAFADITFSSASSRVNIEYGGDTKEYIAQNKHYLEREGIVRKVTNDLDGVEIICKYDKAGGEAASVNLILSVWDMKINAKTDVCKDSTGKVDLDFHEAKTPKPSETHVIKRANEKIKNLVGKAVTRTDKFAATLEFCELVNNKELLKINDVVVFEGKSQTVTECSQGNSCSEGSSGIMNYIIIGIVVGVVALIAAVGGFMWNKKKKQNLEDPDAHHPLK